VKATAVPPFAGAGDIFITDLRESRPRQGGLFDVHVQFLCRPGEVQFLRGSDKTASMT
jgi:hypothetical protein